MLDDFLEKIKAQIEQLRSKIPKKLGGTQKDEDDDLYDEDEEEDEDEEGTEITNIKKIKKQNISDDEDDEDEDLELKDETDVELDEEEDDDEEELSEQEQAKAEKRSKLIKGAAIFVMIIFAYDLLFEEDDTEGQDVAQTREAPSAPDIEREDPPTVAPDITAQMDREEVVPAAPRQEEQQDISPPPREETTTQTPEESQPDDQEFSFDFDDSPDDQEFEFDFESPEDAVSDAPVADADQITEDPEVIDQQPPVAAVSAPSLGEEREREQRSTLDSIAEAIEQSEQIEYVAPPDYERIGRGLVYNCEGRHWACVDRESYFDCQDNSNWHREEGVPTQCHPAAVYATDEDCRIVQLYNINTSESTDFCK